MKTKAVRIYGKQDLRLEEFDLSPMTDDTVICEVVTDSICMSSYKAAQLGAEHARVPNDVATNPTMIGHEFCGKIVKVGKNWAHKYKEGDNFVIQPAHSYKGSMDAPGYSYPECGGNATFVTIPQEILIMDCLLPYQSNDYYLGSLTEPLSCVIASFHAMYHTRDGEYVHDMGIVEGGNMALLASVGPMGLAAIDYALNCDRKPGLLVVTDIDQARLDRAASIYTVEYAKQQGIQLHYVNTRDLPDPVKYLRDLTGNNHGFDDVLVFAPVKPLVEQADQILAVDGCLNFFAGPSDLQFSATMNFYNVHYKRTHVCATSHGNVDDMKEAIKMMNEGRLNPAALITHVGGLDAVVETTLNLPKIPGGKKLIYTHISLPLTAIDEFEEKGKTEPLFAELHKLVQKTNGLWNAEAEALLLSRANKI
ncbi:MAG: zinc-binding dehydrogenase [Clostridiales bacterium]|jgi:threonine dehydrogenase-like Zn-dependent dehydrogenase|nr:zinc-binding dehydrogenase [Clostridiales bacterium]